MIAMSAGALPEFFREFSFQILFGISGLPLLRDPTRRQNGVDMPHFAISNHLTYTIENPCDYFPNSFFTNFGELALDRCAEFSQVASCFRGKGEPVGGAGTEGGCLMSERTPGGTRIAGE
jgi:hypothetical protein